MTGAKAAIFFLGLISQTHVAKLGERWKVLVLLLVLVLMLVLGERFST